MPTRSELAPHAEDFVTSLQEATWELLEKDGFADDQCNRVMLTIAEIEAERRTSSDPRFNHALSEWLHHSAHCGKWRGYRCDCGLIKAIRLQEKKP